jgi:hypothetical protein
MRDLCPVFRFGRLARFDLLCLLGNVDVYDLRPDRLHLVGATGPQDGALRLLGLRAPAGSAELNLLDRRITGIARDSDIDLDALEDTLCNWQKRQPSDPPSHAARSP